MCPLSIYACLSTLHLPTFRPYLLCLLIYSTPAYLHYACQSALRLSLLLLSLPICATAAYLRYTYLSTLQLPIYLRQLIYATPTYLRYAYLSTLRLSIYATPAHLRYTC
jgi:hypothetical protein